MDHETGASKCFGFISFKEHEQAEAAVEAMDGKEIEGKVAILLVLLLTFLLLTFSEIILRKGAEEGGTRGRVEGEI